MTETTNKRKHADDLPTAKKTLKRMCIKPSQSRTNFSCQGQSHNEHICNIFQKEIDTEIASKIKDLETIEERLKECRKDLDLLRKAVVSMYYEPTYKKSTKLDQHRIHPAVKKLIGKRPINSQYAHEEVFEYGTRPLTRHMRKEEIAQQENLGIEKSEQTANRVENLNIEDKVPQYIPPNLSTKGETRLPRGNKHKKQIRILVGNVSKRVTDGSHDKATHKWMLYVRSMGWLEIGRDVSKVRFFLHPSYKPHDVVTVIKAPFTLSRRGWGEFPVRVQLHFHNPLNKTVDILHHLKLDGVSSGPHSRSAETLADIWLYFNMPVEINRPASNCETSENSDDLADSGFVHHSSSSTSNSSEVSDSNISRYNCDKSGTKKTFNNTLFSVNKIELLSGSECSNVSESSQGFNTCLHSDDNYFSKSDEHISCNNRINYNSLCEKPSCSEGRKVNNVIGSQRGSSECNNSSITIDNSFNKIVPNYSNEQTNISNEKYKHINNKNVTVGSCSCNDRSVSDVVSTHNEQSSSLNRKVSFVTKNNFYCNKNSVFNDLETDDFNGDMNIDTMIPNNINLCSDISSNYLKTNFECLVSFNEDNVTTIKEEPTNVGIKENVSDLNNILEAKYNFEDISNIDNLQNISLFVDIEHEKEINSKNKSLSKHVAESTDYIDTKILSTISSVNNLGSVLNPEKNHSPSKLVWIDLDKCKVKSELTLLDNSESTDFAVRGDASVISNIVPILKHQTNCDLKSNPSDNNSLNVNHKYSENSNLNTVIELKPEPKQPDNSNNIESTCNVIIKEEIVEIEDCYSNWIEEVVIDTDCDAVDNYSTVIDSVHGIDVIESNSKDIIIKTEPLSPNQNDLTFCSDEKQNSLKDGYQDVSASTENQFDGLTSSIEDFLNSTMECHLEALKDSKDSFNLSSGITENFDLLENIDERLSSIAETLPKTKTYLSSETYIDTGSKNMMENKLDNTVLELPSLDCFQNYFSSPVESNGYDFQPTTIIPEAVNNNTHSLRATELNASDMELQIKDMPINKELKTSATLLEEVNNISVPTIATTITKSPQTITTPRINKFVSIVSKTTSNPPVLSTKPVKIKPKKSGNLNTLTPGIKVPELGKINSAGIYTLPTNSIVNSSTLPIAATHEGLKHVKVLFKSKDGIISSTPKGLQNGSFILKNGQPVLLQSNGQVHKKTDSVSIPNKPYIILPYRGAVTKKDTDTQFRCSYVPPVKALTNISVNGNKQTSVLRTIPGVSLLKKNIVVTNRAPSVITNNLSAPSLVPNSPLKRVKIYQVLPNNGTIVKESFPSSKTNVSEFSEEELMLSSSSPSSNKLSQRITQVPLLLKKLSPISTNVTGTLQNVKGKKIIVLSKTESKKINFDGRITRLHNSLEKLATDCNFADMELAVRWVVRGLPLITLEANQWIYKVIHPYSVASLAIFKSWPHPKQFASEWLRAKTVCRILERVSKHVDSVWTTKQVLYWARYHGYSPVINLSPGVENKFISVNANLSIEKQNMYTPPENITKWMENSSKQKSVKAEEYEIIDVVGEIKTSQEKKIIQEELEDENGVVLCGREWEKNLGGYVRETVNKLGYRLARDELVPGEVHQGTALTVLTHSMMNFAEDLLRRSLAASYHRKTSSIELNDTYSALISRQEFDIFTNIGLGSCQANNSQP